MTLLSSEKMTCPKCGFKMNHHSDKLVYGSNFHHRGMDEHFDGILEEFHACPNCGAVASRPAAATT